MQIVAVVEVVLRRRPSASGHAASRHFVDGVAVDERRQRAAAVENSLLLGRCRPRLTSVPIER